MVLNQRGQTSYFDLVQDPHKTRNLAGLPEFDDVLHDLRRLALERFVQTAR